MKSEIGCHVVKTREKVVLFFDSSSINRRNAATSLSVAGCQPIVAQSEKEFTDYLKGDGFNLLIYGLEYHDLVVKSRAQKSSSASILLSQTKIKDLGPVFGQISAANILAKNKEGIIKPSELITTTKKIFHKDIFGVKHYVNYGTETETFHVRDSKLRHDYIDALKEYCQKHRIRRSVIQHVEMFCEELLMNAIYDAPRDLEGKELHGHKSRCDHVILKPQDAARLEFACDGEKLVVSVSDPFGAITWQVVQKYLSRCFTKSHITHLNDGAGAGLGLYMCFAAANSFIINVQPDARSEFIGIFDIQSKAKERNELYPSLHFFSTESESVSVGNELSKPAKNKVLIKKKLLTGSD